MVRFPKIDVYGEAYKIPRTHSDIGIHTRCFGDFSTSKKIHLQTYMKHIGYILFPIPDKLQTPKPIKYNTNRLKQTTCKTGVENAKTIISRTTI